MSEDTTLGYSREVIDQHINNARAFLTLALHHIDDVFMQDAPGYINVEAAAAFYNINAALLLLRAVTPEEGNAQT